MNAFAAEMAEKVRSARHSEDRKEIARCALMAIEDGARQSWRRMWLIRPRAPWLAEFLRGQGYTVTETASQWDGPCLEVAL